MMSRYWLAILTVLGTAPEATGEPLELPHAPRIETTLAGALPTRLSETGLFAAGSTVVRPGVLAYSPQYPLWSDGATKRRWLSLPAGSTIDASRPEAWEFPVGTRLWKEFRHGEPVETRFMERLADGSWRFATYVWNGEQTDAWLAPSEGLPSLAVANAPAGRYGIPSREDCLACHDGGVVPVLGVSALQLSSHRDPLAPHAEPVAAGDVDLESLVARGLVRNLPGELLEQPPRIVAASPLEAAALGYLHANCGHCHNDTGPLDFLELSLSHDLHPESVDRTLRSLLNRSSEFRLPGVDKRVVPGAPQSSMLALRMRSRNPLAQMPPLGTRITDGEGLALIEQWIQQETKR